MARTLARPAQYAVHSARNVIWLELTQPSRASGAAALLDVLTHSDKKTESGAQFLFDWRLRVVVEYLLYQAIALQG